ncbi:MAG: CvpA family protein [Deinococcales bacterium]|nr:CvpA family protein [Chitinophagaceae bacterium]
MPVDIIFFIILLSAAYKGYTRGFIVSVVSFLAIIIGLAAAVKLSTVVANWLRESTNISSQWLPFLSFAIIMIVVMILLRLVVNVLQKSVEFLLLGWANKIAGILFYAIIYTLIFSILIFYAEKMAILKQDIIASSKCYPYVQPLGIKVINELGKIVPLFKDLFTQLEAFFSIVSKKVEV